MKQKQMKDMKQKQEEVMDRTKAREEAIIKKAQEQMPRLEIKSITVEKNNGQVHEGISIRRQGDCKSMVLYWPGIWYACGKSCTDAAVVDYICEKAEEELDIRLDHERLFKWETARHMIYKKLVNYEKNADRLESIAHKRYLDLAEVYYMRILIPEKEWGMAEVSPKHLEMWGIGMDELEAAASANITPDQYRLQPMEELLEDMGVPVCPEKTCMYVLWSSSERFAAAAMTAPGLMEQLMGQVGCDCYILPSSLYELIVCPCKKETDADLLREIVQEVNRNAVRPEDFLSDSVYYFDADTVKVELCVGEPAQRTDHKQAVG